MSQPGDDRILESVRADGNLNPAALADRTGYSREYCSKRCSALASYGLLYYVHEPSGLYGLTDDGRAYLNAELDASELSASGD